MLQAGFALCTVELLSSSLSHAVVAGCAGLHRHQYLQGLGHIQPVPTQPETQIGMSGSSICVWPRPVAGTRAL